MEQHKDVFSTVLVSLLPRKLKLSSLRRFFQTVQHEGISKEEYLKRAHAMSTNEVEHIALAKAYSHYQSLLNDAGCMDSSGLLLEAVEIVRHQRHVVCQLTEKGYSHLVVDDLHEMSGAALEVRRLRKKK